MSWNTLWWSCLMKLCMNNSKVKACIRVNGEGWVVDKEITPEPKP